MPVNKRQAKLALFFFGLAQAFDPRHKLRAGKNAGTLFLGLASCKKRSSVSGLGSSHGVLVKSHGWHRSNNSLKPSPLRGLGAGAMIGPSPMPQSGPA